MRRILKAGLTAALAPLLSTALVAGAALPASAVEDPTLWDVHAPTIDSFRLLDPGPYYDGDKVAIEYTATDTGAGGGSGVEGVWFLFKTDVGQTFVAVSDPFHNERGQTHVTGTATIVLDHNADAGHPVATSTARLYEALVFDHEQNQRWYDDYEEMLPFPSWEETRFGINQLAQFGNGEAWLSTAGDGLAAELLISPPTPPSSFEWQRDGVTIPGATDSTYTPTDADRGKAITVTITASREGFEHVELVSRSIVPAYEQFWAREPVSITGTPQAGETLVASTPAWGPVPTSYEYQWFRNGTAIPGATSTSYKLTEADVLTNITVTVLGRKLGYNADPAVSAATWILKDKWPLYKNTFDGDIYELVTNGDGSQTPVHLTFDRWRDVYNYGQGWGFRSTDTAFVKYPWSPHVFAVTFWPGGETAWQWTKVTYEQWRTAGFPQPRIAGWIAGSDYYQYPTSGEIFVSQEGVIHKLTYAEWRDSGFREPHLRQDTGFYKLSWSSEIFEYGSVSRNQGWLVYYSSWQYNDFPTPKVVTRVPGDSFYWGAGGQIRYKAPGVDRAISYNEWRAVGFPQPN